MGHNNLATRTQRHHIQATCRSAVAPGGPQHNGRQLVVTECPARSRQKRHHTVSKRVIWPLGSRLCHLATRHNHGKNKGWTHGYFRVIRVQAKPPQPLPVKSALSAVLVEASARAKVS
jgi:hypothetical protein